MGRKGRSKMGRKVGNVEVIGIVRGRGKDRGGPGDAEGWKGRKGKEEVKGKRMGWEERRSMGRKGRRR